MHSPDLPLRAFQRAPFKNRPATLEGGKGGSAPAAPDPYTTAAAQTQTNEQTAAYNKALNLNNYSNPFGSQSSTITGYDPSTGAPIYQTTNSASAGLSSALSSLMGQAGTAGSTNASALAGLKGLSSSISPQAAAAAQAQGQQAAYASQTQYLDPQFAQQGESLSAQLANQGITPGSEAYNNAMTNFNNTKQQAYSNAANQSILTGSQLGTQNLNNQLATVGQLSSLYGQQAGIGQLSTSELGSLAGLVPGYTGTTTSNAGSTDIASLFNNQYQSQLAGYNADQQSANSTTSTIAGLAGMAAIAFF